LGSRFIEKKTRREGYSTYDESLFDKNREYLIRTSLHLLLDFIFYRMLSGRVARTALGRISLRCGSSSKYDAHNAVALPEAYDGPLQGFVNDEATEILPPTGKNSVK